MSDDLVVAFYRACLAEVEAVALAATVKPWRLDNSDSDAYWNGRNWEFGENVSARHNLCTHWRIWGPSVHIETSAAYQVADMRHIALHDPARVLREIETKREILTEHAPDSAGHCSVCITTRYGWQEDWPLDKWPCRTVRCLVADFRDHPDYRQEWAPGPSAI